ncbi:hypothetical protein [Phytohabitans suffuscus]|nr:hypothetical protein [Phytohabitans suffuscus]
MTTAWRKAVDRLRRERAGRDKLALVAGEPPAEPLARRLGPAPGSAW